MRALGIAISSSVLGTSLVVGVLGLTTVGVHLHKVHGTVKTARQLGNVNVEGELLVLGLEHLVAGVGSIHQVDSGADVLASALSDELVSERISAGSDTIGSGVVGTIDGAVLGAGHRIRADGGIPSAAGVAIGVASGGVEPAPVGIKHDRRRLVHTAPGGCALCPGEFGMYFCGVGANLLGRGEGEEEGDGDDEGHDVLSGCCTVKDLYWECGLRLSEGGD